MSFSAVLSKTTATLPVVAIFKTPYRLPRHCHATFIVQSTFTGDGPLKTTSVSGHSAGLLGLCCNFVPLSLQVADFFLLPSDDRQVVLDYNH